MKASHVILVVVAAIALIALGATSGPKSPTGRYRLTNGQMVFTYYDGDRLVTRERQLLIKLDTVTGDTWQWMEISPDGTLIQAWQPCETVNKAWQPPEAEATNPTTKPATTP